MVAPSSFLCSLGERRLTTSREHVGDLQAQLGANTALKCDLRIKSLEVSTWVHRLDATLPVTTKAGSSRAL